MAFKNKQTEKKSKQEEKATPVIEKAGSLRSLFQKNKKKKERKNDNSTTTNCSNSSLSALSLKKLGENDNQPQEEESLGGRNTCDINSSITTIATMNSSDGSMPWGPPQQDEERLTPHSKSGSENSALSKDSSDIEKEGGESYRPSMMMKQKFQFQSKGQSKGQPKRQLKRQSKRQSKRLLPNYFDTCSSVSSSMNFTTSMNFGNFGGGNSSKSSAHAVQQCGDDDDHGEFSTADDSMFFLANTKLFERICDSAFDWVDTKKFGFIDEKELYSGLLLIHLKLGSYVGPFACKPVNREQSKMLFTRFNKYGKGLVGRDDFKEIAKILFNDILFRISVMWMLTVVIVPIITKVTYDGCVWCFGTLLPNIVYACWHCVYVCWYCYSTIVTANNTNDMISDNHTFSSFLSSYSSSFLDYTTTTTPYHYYESLSSNFWGLVYMIVSEKFIKSIIPLTFTACILSMCIIPWILDRVGDVYSQKVVSARQERQQEEEEERHRCQQKQQQQQKQQRLSLLLYKQ